MAIPYGKKQTAPQKAEAVKKRLGPSMDNKKPGYKPPPTTKIKPTGSLKKPGFKITIKG